MTTDRNRRQLERARERVLDGGDSPAARHAVRASWVRASASGVRPERYLPPVALTDVETVRHDHPLACVWPTIQHALRGVLTEPGHLLFVSDANGNLLWAAGDKQSLRSAERVHLVPGACWSEDTAGTSGVGTALQLRRPFQVYGAEHYLSVATSYTCSAAPIRDPATGQPLGTVDITCGMGSPRRLLLSLVVTAAGLAEAQLRVRAEQRYARLHSRYGNRLARRTGARSAIVAASGQVLHADPSGWLPGPLPDPLREGPTVLADGRAVTVERLGHDGPYLVFRGAGHTAPDDPPAVSCVLLGRRRTLVRTSATTLELSARHGDLLAMLLANPDGLSADELTREVYGPAGKRVTTRAEIARLRLAIGPLVQAEPYRVTPPVTADFVDLDRTLRDGDPADVLDTYPGPLLPGSTAPGVVALRDRLHRRVRTRVLCDGDDEVRARWFSRSVRH